MLLTCSLSNFTAMQALRPLSISAALDLVLAHPQWKDHIDAARIGGFGASMGGETMMLLGGARLTTSYPGCRRIRLPSIAESRRRSARAVFGQPVLPAFGTRPAWARRIDLPFLASADGDTTPRSPK